MSKVKIAIFAAAVLTQHLLQGCELVTAEYLWPEQEMYSAMPLPIASLVEVNFDSKSGRLTAVVSPDYGSLSKNGEYRVDGDMMFNVDAMEVNIYIFAHGSNVKTQLPEKVSVTRLARQDGVYSIYSGVDRNYLGKVDIKLELQQFQVSANSSL